MKHTIIRKDLLEVHKPSSQIATTYELNGKPHSITPFQFDAINYICYQAQEQISERYKLTSPDKNAPINKDNKVKYAQIESIAGPFLDDEIFNFIRNQVTTIDLKEMSSFLNKYKNGHRTAISNSIKQLEHIMITVGYMKQDDFLIEDSFNVISRTRRKGNSNTIEIWLEPELIIGWVFNATPFAKLHLKIVALLTTTISKKLYELLTDYDYKNTIPKDKIRELRPIEFKMFKQILGIPENKSNKIMSQVKRTYLNKAVVEINKLTHIHIIDITHKKKNGVVEVFIKFKIQDCELIDNYDEVSELPIEEQIELNKLWSKSKSKLTKLVANGYKLQDEEAWIKADIKNNKKIYEAQYELDVYLRSVEDMTQEDKFEEMSSLARFIKSNDPIILIKDYKIEDMSGNALTANAIETRKVILEFQELQEL